MEPEALYGTFRKQLLRYCQAMTKNPSSAEDLVQETYLRALTHWEDIENLSAGQCRSWLYSTARNLYIDQLRKLSRETPAQEDELARTPFEEDLSRAAVLQLISRLPDGERALFTMRYFEGWNARELGEMFDLPAATVRSRLACARQRLRRWIVE